MVAYTVKTTLYIKKSSCNARNILSVFFFSIFYYPTIYGKDMPNAAASFTVNFTSFFILCSYLTPFIDESCKTSGA